jgi:type I restriction enzyme, S subunit
MSDVRIPYASETLPRHWRVQQAKTLYDIQLGKMLQTKSEGSDDTEIEYLKAAHVQWQAVSVQDLPTMWASPRDTQQYAVANGDLLVCEGGEVGRAAIVDMLAGPTIIQNALHRVRPCQGDARFFMYFLHHVADTGWFEVVCNRTTIAHLTGEKLRALLVPTPPLPEQRAIAHFLDRKTKAIDDLIQKKERLIERLQEKCQALITQAVTKGLDLSVTMKDSGIEWLGEIPAHWTVGVKLVNLTGTERGAFVNGPFGSDLLTEELTDEGVPVVYIRDIKPGRYLRKSSACVTLEKATALNFCRVDPGDVVIAKVGDPPCDACVYPLGEPSGIVTQDVIRMKLKSFVNSTYVTALLNSHYGRSLVEQITVEATRARVSLADFKKLRVMLPPKEEQEAIASYLEGVGRHLDSIEPAIQTQIEKLHEYRQALISAAVTGKIDVTREG